MVDVKQDWVSRGERVWVKVEDVGSASSSVEDVGSASSSEEVDKRKIKHNNLDSE